MTSTLYMCMSQRCHCSSGWLKAEQGPSAFLRHSWSTSSLNVITLILVQKRTSPLLVSFPQLTSFKKWSEVFADQDSFLPSAIARYHQLFMPALQVVDGILATVGSKHATATQQVRHFLSLRCNVMLMLHKKALSFLSSHGSTIAILLKNEADYISLANLEEIHLIISLCTSVLPSVPKEELV
jgi:nuclear pore complex protein Nup205